MIARQFLRPFPDHRLERLAHRKERGGDGLGPLGLHVARVLEQRPVRKVQVLQPQGRHRRVTRAGQHDQGDYGAVAPLDHRRRRHGLDDVANLLQRRRRPLARGGGDPRLVVGDVEIGGVGEHQGLAITGLARQPLKERPQGFQRRIERGLAKRLACGLALLSSQMSLEADRLFAPKGLEALVTVEGFEAVDSGGDKVQGGGAAPSRVAQPGEVFALGQLVFGVVFAHGSGGLSEVTIQGGGRAIG